MPNVRFVIVYEEPGRVSVWSLQSDDLVSIENGASYGCTACGRSEFVGVPASAPTLHHSPSA